MKIFLAILAAVVYAIGVAIVNRKLNSRIEAICSFAREPSNDEALEIARLEKLRLRIGFACLAAACLAMFFIVDNWQTGVTLIMVASMIPMFAKDLSNGVLWFVVVIFAMIIIWQLPSSQRTEELVVSEGVNLASFATTDGQMTDSLIIEDHGKYTLVVDDGPGKIRHETVPAEIVSGCYIDDEASSVATFNYTETYRRTFWSKKCTKLKKRELTAVYLYIKRWQMVDTFSVQHQS